MKKLLLISLALMLFGIACKTTSKVQQGEQTKATVPSLKKENVRTLAAKIKSNELNYKWISAHTSVDMDIDSEHYSFSGNLRMRKDSLIWMSISKLGIKVAQIMLTEDSAMRIDYIHDVYSKGDYSFINSKLDNDVDFEMVQSVMAGSSMEFYNDTSKMKSYFDGKQYIISTIRKRHLKRVLYRNKPFHSKDDGQFIFLDPVDFHITHVRVEDFVNHRTFDAFYSDYQKVDSVMFPCHIQYTIKAEKLIKVDMQYKKVAFKTTEETPFTIPKKYDRVQY
jgi:hypothetical protein